LWKKHAVDVMSSPSQTRPHPPLKPWQAHLLLQLLRLLLELLDLRLLPLCTHPQLQHSGRRKMGEQQLRSHDVARYGFILSTSNAQPVGKTDA
jgi:hypothetical protein